MVRFSDDNKQKLLRLARAAIAGDRSFEIPDMDDELRVKRGCFVSLHTLDGNLRGCIGNFSSSAELHANVRRMATEAAFSDPRFPPVTANELPNIHIEISVLSEMVKVFDTEEILVGRDGLFIVSHSNSGVLLPQVAVSNNWDKEHFLSQTCLKAGIHKDAWKTDDVDIYRFEAHIFSEN